MAMVDMLRESYDESEECSSIRASFTSDMHPKYQLEASSPCLMKMDRSFSLCQHLQNEVRSIQNVFSQFHCDIQSVRDQANSAQDEVTSLRADLASASSRFDDFCKDHSRSCMSVADIQASISHCQETMLVMDESRKMLSTKLDSVAREQSQCKHDQQRLHDKVELLSVGEIRGLQQELANMRVVVEQARKEQSILAESACSNSCSLRDARNDVEQCVGEIKKLTTFSNILDDRLNKAGKCIQIMQSRHGDIDTRLAKMDERSDTMQVKLYGYEERFRVATDSTRALQKEAEDRRNQIDRISGEVNRIMEVFDESMKLVSQNQTQIGALKAAYEKFQGRMNLIHHEVTELSKDTQELQAVSEQRALSLPSIEPTSPEPFMSSRCEKWSVSSAASTTAASPTSSRAVSIASVAPHTCRPKSQNAFRGSPSPLRLGSPQIAEKAWA